jgi:hypothetical protein
MEGLEAWCKAHVGREIANGHSFSAFGKEFSRGQTFWGTHPHNHNAFHFHSQDITLTLSNSGNYRVDRHGPYVIGERECTDTMRKIFSGEGGQACGGWGGWYNNRFGTVSQIIAVPTYVVLSAKYICIHVVS